MTKTTKPNAAYSSSSHQSLSLMKRQATVFKKARELSVLCAIEVCVICYGADGTLKTYSEEREKVEAIARRYAALSETKRRKRSVDLHEFLAKSNKKKLVRPRRVSKFPVWDPRFDNYSGAQVTGLVQSLERNLTRLQDRFRAVEEQRKMNQGPSASSSTTTNTINQYLLPQQQQPNQFSMFLFNHENGNVSQIPLGLMNQGQSLMAPIPPELLMIHLNADVGNYNLGSLGVQGAFGPPLYDLSQPLFS
ncbi:PREDICTED: agamous-like MADS-box protein AGL103 [Camelina sativa]|uniref:Agamous-like MADS-box protein AGL103 n=1 Tax=Camelina sativa TaxID=90675 RepID=A0ABM0SL10_CAMSA|nr:PREDICTED: agamous-like MADS-box protein AGL103 [Camelina sativa]